MKLIQKLRNKTMKNKIMRNLVVIVIVLVALIAAGCTGPKTDITVDTGVTISPPTPAAVTPAVTPRPTPIVTPTPTPVLTYQDSEYIYWCIDTADSISLDLYLTSSAAEGADFEGVELYSGMLYDDAKKALDEIDQFDVSSALKPSKDEFTLALQCFKQAGYYGEKGARNYDVEDIEIATDYIKKAHRHLDRANDLLS